MKLLILMQSLTLTFLAALNPQAITSLPTLWIYLPSMTLSCLLIWSYATLILMTSGIHDVELIDAWTDIDADDFNETDAELYVRSTADDPSGTPTWSTWEPFVNSTKRGRAFQFKVEMATDNTSQDPIIEALGVTVSLQRRTEQQSNISTGTSAKAITFPSAFYSTPSVTVTATDMATGDFFELTSIS